MSTQQPELFAAPSQAPRSGEPQVCRESDSAAPSEAKKVEHENASVASLSSSKAARIVALTQRLTLTDEERGELDRLLDRHVAVDSPSLTRWLYRPPPEGWGFPERYIKLGARNTDRLSRSLDTLLSAYRVEKDRRLALVLRLLALETDRKALDVKLDKDRRWRTSVNLAGDAFGRWATYQSCTGSGAGLHSIPLSQRRLFRADPGYDFYVLTLRNADAWTIAAECAVLGDNTLLDDLKVGCEIEPVALLATAYGQGDVALSERYLELAYRQGEKLSVISAAACKKQQALVAERYPGLRRRTERVKMLLQRDGKLTAACGLTRDFFGRKTDVATLKEALAFGPRANTAFLAHQLLLDLWKQGFQPFGVTHEDAFGEASVLGQSQALGTVSTEPLAVAGTTFTVPLTIARGPSWGEAIPL